MFSFVRQNLLSMILQRNSKTRTLSIQDKWETAGLTDIVTVITQKNSNMAASEEDGRDLNIDSMHL
jgi:hypothetical protein